MPFIHIHAGISQDDFLVYGGHVIDAYSGSVSEFMISPLPHRVHRSFNSQLNIYTIDDKLSQESK